MLRRLSGFTLLESLVVLAIIGLLVSAGIPAFQTMTLNMTMRAAVSRLASDLNYARFAAIDLNSAVTICPSHSTPTCLSTPDWHQGWVVFSDTNADRSRQLSEPVLRHSPALKGMTALTSISRRAIRFSPTGAAGGTNATIRFCDRRGFTYSQQVRVGLTGRIRTTRRGDPLNDHC